jgi:hypothetical protein
VLTVTETPESVAFNRPPINYPAGRDIAEDSILAFSAKATYWYLSTRCTFGSYVTVKRWAIERALKMDAHTVTRALRSLEQHGYVMIAPSGESRAKAYRLVWERRARQASPAA